MFTELEEKASVYFLFSRLFREAPDELLLKEVVEKRLLTLASQFDRESLRAPNKFVIASPKGEAISEIASLASPPRNDDSSRVLLDTLSGKEFLEDPHWLDQVEDIAIEHTALFVVSGESYIPPYESYYCDALTIDTATADSCYFQSEPFPEGMKGFISGPSARAVEKFYQENGFDISPNFHDLPDHIACELEFMGKLYEEGEPDRAQTFFENHLGRWIFRFLANVKDQNRSDFYKEVAVSLASFLREFCKSYSV